MAEPVAAALSQAAELTAAGEPLAAVAVLRPVLAEHPDNSEAWCRLSAACLDAGHPDVSLDAAKRAITLGERSWGHRLASLALVELGRRDEALVSAREAVRRDPEDWRCHVALAEALDRADPAEAVRAARQGADLAPGEARPFEVLGDVALHAHDVATARWAYHRALVIDPTSEHARVHLRGLAGTTPDRRLGGSRTRVLPPKPVAAPVPAAPDESRPPELIDLTAPHGVPPRTVPSLPSMQSVPAAPTAPTAPAAPSVQSAPATSSVRSVRSVPSTRSGSSRPWAQPSRPARPARPSRPPDGPSQAQRAQQRRRRVARIGLYLVLRRVASWQAVGAFVLLLAGLPSPSGLLAWGGVALLVAVGTVCLRGWFGLPASARESPVPLARATRLLAAAAVAAGLGTLLLLVWSVTLALGAHGLQLLVTVVVCALVTAGLCALGLGSKDA